MGARRLNIMGYCPYVFLSFLEFFGLSILFCFSYVLVVFGCEWSKKKQTNVIMLKCSLR